MVLPWGRLAVDIVLKATLRPPCVSTTKNNPDRQGCFLLISANNFAEYFQLLIASGLGSFCAVKIALLTNVDIKRYNMDSILSNSLSGQIAGAVGDNTHGHSIQSDLDFEEAYPDNGIQDDRLQTKKDTADQGQPVRPAGLARLNSQQGT